jgi:hypothetical protein
MAPGSPVSDTSSDEQTLTRHSRDWLELLDECRSCPMILQEVETLNLAQLCDPMHINHEDHWEMHGYPDLSMGIYLAVLRWLRVSSIQPLNNVALIFWDLPQRFLELPLQTIAFWEKQLEVFQACEHSV